MSEPLFGKGDPVKTLQLLWGKSAAPKRGPRSKVSLDEIVRAAIKLADEKGLEAVSARNVAKAVGISPMSLYTHVPGMHELLDMMHDAAVGENSALRPDWGDWPWRRRVELFARSLRDFYLAHPWVLDIETHRPVLGPCTMAAYETALSAVDGIGLDEIGMDMAVTMVGNYVFGAVRDAARQQRVDAATGMTDAEWWHTVAPFLETLDYSPYPVASRVGPVTGEAYGLHDPNRAFDFGLECLLDGLALKIEKHTKGNNA